MDQEGSMPRELAASFNPEAPTFTPLTPNPTGTTAENSPFRPIGNSRPIYLGRRAANLARGPTRSPARGLRHFMAWHETQRQHQTPQDRSMTALRAGPSTAPMDNAVAPLPGLFSTQQVEPRFITPDIDELNAFLGLPGANKAVTELPEGKAVTELPEGKKAVTELPEAKKPATEKSEGKKPATELPEVKKPATEQSEVKKPANERSEVKKPATEHSEVKKPATEQSDVKKPATDLPGMKKATTDDSPARSHQFRPFQGLNESVYGKLIDRALERPLTADDLAQIFNSMSGPSGDTGTASGGAPHVHQQGYGPGPSGTARNDGGNQTMKLRPPPPYPPPGLGDDLPRIMPAQHNQGIRVVLPPRGPLPSAGRGLPRIMPAQDNQAMSAIPSSPRPPPGLPHGLGGGFPRTMQAQDNRAMNAIPPSPCPPRGPPPSSGRGLPRIRPAQDNQDMMGILPLLEPPPGPRPTFGRDLPRNMPAQERGVIAQAARQPQHMSTGPGAAFGQPRRVADLPNVPASPAASGQAQLRRLSDLQYVRRLSDLPNIPTSPAVSGQPQLRRVSDLQYVRRLSDLPSISASPAPFGHARRGSDLQYVPASPAASGQPRRVSDGLQYAPASPAASVQSRHVSDLHVRKGQNEYQPRRQSNAGPLRQRTSTHSSRSDQGPQPSHADIFPDDYQPRRPSYQQEPAGNSFPTPLPGLGPQLSVEHFEAEARPFLPEPYTQQSSNSWSQRNTAPSVVGPQGQAQPQMRPQFEEDHANAQQHYPPTPADIAATDADVLYLLDHLPNNNDGDGPDLPCDERPLTPQQLTGECYGISLTAMGRSGQWNAPAAEEGVPFRVRPLDHEGWGGWEWALTRCGWGDEIVKRGLGWVFLVEGPGIYAKFLPSIARKGIPFGVLEEKDGGS
ncbi:hypothetical protein BDW02DRAFT_646761 [Decorospora gaudefroyi]|uniref:Uncharacterized protein n=1 Tax=Decorospora gaudefroyi TaxID=184978 RepID=A0A6A5KPJ4_9PLEO|nr:hypothetical protein BDW02DRAFT_646761 [Decorospora gaudefroyi]